MSEVLNGEVLKNLSFEELLALGVNEVADVEEFKLVPVGYFVFEVTESEVKTPDEADAQPFVQVGITIQGIQELKDPTQAESVVAGETKSNFRYYGSMGIQRFKTTFKSVAEHYAAQGEALSVFDLIDKIKGHQFVGYIDQRKVKPKVAKGEKVDPDDIKIYNDLNPQSVALAG